MEMHEVLRCDCGFKARADDEDRLVLEVQRHAREVHEMVLSRDDALLVAFRAELDAHRIVETAPSRKE